MRSRLCITSRNVFLLILLFSAQAFGQRLAILTPDNSASDNSYASELATRLSPKVRLVDPDQASAAFRSLTIPNPFNMSIAEAQAAAAVMGVDHFLVLRSATQRRTSITRADYYEAYAAHFLVDGRTGEMILWRLRSFEADTAVKADASLVASLDGTTAELISTVKSSTAGFFAQTPKQQIESVPDEGSPAAADLKTPVPYRRIKPEYTETAFLYEVKATVDIEVDIGADGAILGTRIVRWAGFGLEGSVEKAVRAMNWRPAMRGGRPLPMRVLLRYNFTKMSKE
jgi:Gram-negative bacterial TonB protein C-terminal